MTEIGILGIVQYSNHWPCVTPEFFKYGQYNGNTDQFKRYTTVLDSMQL